MTQWTTKAFSNNSTPLELTDDILEEKVVILLQGENNFGDAIFSYLQLTLRNLQQLKHFLQSGEKFMPSDFGTVLAAGRGEPNQELRSEMAVTYKMVDRPQAVRTSKTQKPKLGSFTAAIQYSPED